MTRLRVASLNMSGVQSEGEWKRFVRRMEVLAREERVGVVLGQEHNLSPDRAGDAARYAERRGFAVVMAHAPCAQDGVNRGGVLVMLRTDMVEWPDTDEKRAECVIHSEPGALVVKVGWHGRELHVGSVYAPSKPTPRVDFFTNMRKWITEDMILGGDWNCVPDTTLDVQSSDPTRYANIGAQLLDEVMADVDLYDFRRDQLLLKKEPTRAPLGAVHTKTGPDTVLTRLDRFYIPTNDAHEDLLASLQVRWDVIWSHRLRPRSRDHGSRQCCRRRRPSTPYSQ